MQFVVSLNASYSTLSFVLPTATVDGSIGFILPVPERMYHRLNMLQTKMTQGFSHPAGLNPKAARLNHTCTTSSYGLADSHVQQFNLEKVYNAIHKTWTNCHEV